MTGALAAEGYHTLLSYGHGEDVYANKSYSLTATYADGVPQIRLCQHLARWFRYDGRS